jgi:hypothetical protein
MVDVGDKGAILKNHYLPQGSVEAGDKVFVLSASGKDRVFTGNPGVGDKVKVLSYNGRRYVLKPNECPADSELVLFTTGGEPYPDEPLTLIWYSIEKEWSYGSAPKMVLDRDSNLILAYITNDGGPTYGRTIAFTQYYAASGYTTKRTNTYTVTSRNGWWIGFDTLLIDKTQSTSVDRMYYGGWFYNSDSGIYDYIIIQAYWSGETFFYNSMFIIKPALEHFYNWFDTVGYCYGKNPYFLYWERESLSDPRNMLSILWYNVDTNRWYKGSIKNDFYPLPDGQKNLYLYANSDLGYVYFGGIYSAIHGLNELLEVLHFKLHVPTNTVSIVEDTVGHFYEEFAANGTISAFYNPLDNVVQTTYISYGVPIYDAVNGFLINYDLDNRITYCIEQNKFNTRPPRQHVGTTAGVDTMGVGHSFFAKPDSLKSLYYYYIKPMTTGADIYYFTIIDATICNMSDYEPYLQSCMNWNNTIPYCLIYRRL